MSNFFNPGGLPLLQDFLRASFHPDFSPSFLQLTGEASLRTLAYAVCGTFLSVVLGIIGGLFSSQVWWSTLFPHRPYSKWLWLGVRGLLAIPRAIHEMIWGLLFLNIWGLDPLTAILAIAIPFGAIVAKVFSEILDNTPLHPLLALINSGISPPTAFLYSLIPQAFLYLLSYTFYRFECSLRSATVLGMIGAGGLGYQIFLSLQSLRYEQLWTLFYALMVLNGIVDISSAFFRHRLGSSSSQSSNQFSRISLSLCVPRGNRDPANHLNQQQFPLTEEKNDSHNLWLKSLGIFYIVLVFFCFKSLSIDLHRLFSPQSFTQLLDILIQFFPPNFEGISWQTLGILSSQTLLMSLLATLLAGIGGLILSFPGAYNFFLPGGLLFPQFQTAKIGSVIALIGFGLTRLFLLYCRAIPAPIWALIVLFIFFPGILPGAIALGVHNLGILGRLMAEGNENLKKQPLQGLKAQGTPAASLFLYGVLPMILPRALAYTFYRWEVCIRETIIVGLVGAGGLGRLLTEQLSSFDYPGITVTLGCLIVLTWIVDLMSRRVQREV